VSSRSGDQASAQELALAKALKLKKKFSSGSSGLSLTEKASATHIGIREGKRSLPQTDVSGAGMSSKALDLFRSGSFAYKNEVVAPVPCQ
jgi:hypothetical protein